MTPRGGRRHTAGQCHVIPTDVHVHCSAMSSLWWIHTAHNIGQQRVCITVIYTLSTIFKMCFWVGRDIASFPGLPRGEGRPGTHCSRMPRNFPTFKHGKYMRVPRNYRNVGKFGACVNSVYQSPAPRKAWERG